MADNAPLIGGYFQIRPQYTEIWELLLQTRGLGQGKEVCCCLNFRLGPYF